MQVSLKVEFLFPSRFSAAVVACLAGGPPGNDRNYKMGDDMLDHAKERSMTLGAKREYLRKKYVPDDAEYCRVECPFFTGDLSSPLIPNNGRVIKVLICALLRLS